MDEKAEIAPSIQMAAFTGWAAGRDGVAIVMRPTMQFADTTSIEIHIGNHGAALMA